MICFATASPGSATTRHWSFFMGALDGIRPRHPSR
jgi:hypothetical protein